MKPVKLVEEAKRLPLWSSRIFAQVGGANVKVEQVGTDGQDEETHDDFPEVLLMLEGRMQLECGGQPVTIGEGEVFVVPQGVPHRVLPGGGGVVLIVNQYPGAFADWAMTQK